VTRPASKRRRESALERRCVKWARERGIQVGKLSECVGLPDRIFFTPKAKGGPLIPEFKDPGGWGDPSPAQEWHVAELKRKGYVSEFVDSWETFLTIMKKRGVE
jgi:hypothetical protein